MELSLANFIDRVVGRVKVKALEMEARDGAKVQPGTRLITSYGRALGSNCRL